MISTMILLILEGKTEKAMGPCSTDSQTAVQPFQGVRLDAFNFLRNFKTELVYILNNSIFKFYLN